MNLMKLKNMLIAAREIIKKRLAERFCVSVLSVELSSWAGFCISFRAQLIRGQRLWFLVLRLV